MKKLLYILAAAGIIAACSPEEINHPSEADIPATASAFEPVISVDQETNQVTFTLGTEAIIPVWVFQDKDGEWTEYHTGDGFKKIFASAGDYAVRFYAMNAAGTTPDYVTKTFHINNTLVNFDRYIRYLAGSSEKTWRIDNSLDGHQACGESVANAAGWWAAKPDEKADYGLYDNRLTFTADGKYTFDPGDAGTVYVNTGVTASPYGEFRQDADYNVAVEAQTTTYSFAVDGNDLLLTFPEGTLFPYIPNNEFISNVTFNVISLDANAMDIVWYTPTGNNGGPIAWQFLLTSKAGEFVFNGFKYNAESNIWKPADEEGHTTVSYYYAPGWSQIADPEMTHSGSKYTWTLPEATSERWQAQVFIVPDPAISLTSAKNYDFSCILNASAAFTAKVKVHRFDENGSDADNATTLVDAEVPLTANEDVIYYLSDIPGIDANNIRIVLDFGGNPAGTDVTVSNIVIKDHAIDDGTVLPEENPDNPEDPDKPGYTYGDNLLGGLTFKEHWFSAAGWGGGLDPALTFEGGKLTLTVPEVGGEEWMGQVKLVADVAVDPEKRYSFSAKIESAEDGTATVKLADAADDTNHAFFYDNKVALTGSQVVSYVNEPTSPDQAYDAVMVIFDFGRMAPGTEITVTEIQLREITGETGGNDGPIEGENLWAAAEVEYTYWYSEGDWSGNLAPAEQELLEGNGLRVVMPDGIGGSEWMGQNALHAPGINASKDEAYDFWMTLEADEDMTVTVKLAWNGHDTTNAFFYDPNVSLKAGEPLVYQQLNIITDPKADERNDYEGIVLFVDTGRSPAGSEVKMTGIHFQKHIAGGGEPEPEESDYTTNDPTIDPSIYKIEAETNLWRKAAISFDYWYSEGDWSGNLAPITFKADDWSGLKIIVPEGIGGNEWMGQSKWHTDIPASKDGLYDFCFSVKSDEDIPAMTVKLAWEGNDNDHSFFYVNNAVVKEGIKYQFRMQAMAPDVDYDKIVLIIDLGRCKAGTAVTITDFCFQANAASTTKTEIWPEPTGVTLGYYYAPGWNQIADPQCEISGSKFTWQFPSATSDRWQAQVFMVPTAAVALSAASVYDFQCTINASASFTCKVKLHRYDEEGSDADNGILMLDQDVALTADQDVTVSLKDLQGIDGNNIRIVMDFGGNPDNAEVSVSGISLKRHD